MSGEGGRTIEGKSIPQRVAPWTRKADAWTPEGLLATCRRGEAAKPQTRLGCEVLNAMDPQITAAHWPCRALGAWDKLYAQFPLGADPQDLAACLDLIPGHWQSGEARRLRALLNTQVLPAVRAYIPALHQDALVRYLRCITVLRLLDIPYRAASVTDTPPQLLAALLTLHMHCPTLRVWTEGTHMTFVVESELEHYLVWVLRRMAEMLTAADRDKGVADAVWAALFAGPTFPARAVQEISLADAGGAPLVISGVEFPGREAVLLRVNDHYSRAVVFESPWPADLGRRATHAAAHWPAGITPQRVWIWEPVRLSADAARTVREHLAAARALRHALLHQEDEADGDTSVALALRRCYVRYSGDAWAALVHSYQQGRIITPHGIALPVPHANLNGTLAHLVTHMLNTGVFG